MPMPAAPAMAIAPVRPPDDAGRAAETAFGSERAAFADEEMLDV